MLAAACHPLFDQQFYGTRIDREVPHRRCEKLVFLISNGMQNVFDRDVILVAFFDSSKADSKTRRPLSLNLSLYASISAIKPFLFAGKLDAGLG